MAEVRQRDTCPEPTESRLIGCLTESICTQKSKSNTLTPRTADLLTKGNFTRDEWNHLLCLFNIMSFSVFSCSHSGLINKPKTMSKRQQEETSREEERVVAKSKAMMSLVSKTANRSSASSPGTLGAQSSLSDRTSIGKAVAEGLNENTASSSQVWRSGANTNTSMVKLVVETRNKHIGTKLSHYNFQILMLTILRKSVRMYDRN